ncbi:MAG TPA: lipoprotein [Usitatibacter sp.]|nr:lipoprotein [Usitatibacter sp.]
MIRALALATLLALVAACGQKGPLRLPEAPGPAVPPPAPGAPTSSP